ncbi:MAG: InlB B-repeat-containing protein [Vescimonas sp.]
MKKRLLSMVLTVIMLVSLIPTSVFAAKKSVDDYFDGLPIAADPGTGTTAWKVSTKDGEEVLMSGNAGKNYSSSTLTLTFTEDTHLSFEYKVSSEAKYDKCTITLGSNTLVNGESGDQEWKGLELDAKRGDKLTVLYKKDSSGDKFDDCVYLRNFSAGEALVVTFHANNGTEDTATQKIFGGKGTLKANTFTCEGKIFAGWATSAGGAVAYEDGAAITTETDLDLYAVWSDAYTVTLRNGDTDTTVLVPQNSAIGSRIPADPTKKGYTFEGWFNGEEKLTAETVISGDVIYTAQWSPITYTIAFSGGEGGQGAMDSIPATYDQEVTLPKNTFTRPGYYFNGWSTSSGASSGSYADEKPVKNLTTKQGETVTLYAAWYGLPVNVTLHPNYDGAENGTRTCVVGSNYNYILKEGGGTKFDAIEDPVRTGYIFDGWFDAAEGGNAVGPSYKFTAVDAENGFHLYAHWTKGITVHFDGNGYKNTLKDKTVTPDKVFSSLPSLSSYYYPANKALDGWYIKNVDGSFGEAVTKDTVFSGDEVTLIAKWRDYQYIIKYNVKYSDKNTTTGTMADQTAPFGQDVQLAPCGFSREGYTFAGWAESSYGSTVKYADGATINRPFEEGDDWDNGSEDGETYNLYAVWTESKSPEQSEAEAKLEAAEKAIGGTYNVTYGKDTNALTMLRAKLEAAGITDVTVSMKEASYSSYNHVGITADGTIQYKWNENGSTTAASGTVRPTLVLTCNTYTKESTECLFSIPLDEEKAMEALRTVAARISVPETVESASDLTSLPKYPLKAGVDESKVDYSSGTDQELWTTATWTSSNTGVISFKEVSYPYFAPYTVTVAQPKKDTSVTLTLKLVYNGREDLNLNMVYTVVVKGDNTPPAMDYQALLETAVREIGLKDPRDNSKIDTTNVVSDIQLPTTKQLSAISYRDYEQGFDGKYTPIMLYTSDADVVVSAGPTTANVARMLTYRPLPGQEAKTVTITMKILSRPSGEGTDYASMPVLASKDITLTVQALTQEELDTAAAFMRLVCTEDVYWEGIRKANADRDHVTGDMRSFIEIVPATTGYKFIRNMDSYNAVGVKADDIPGWYDAQQYRCFRSSNNAVVAHETLLVTQPKYNTRITVDSVLTYTQYAKYYEKFQGNADYEQFAQFYKQPISTTVTVIGTEGIEDPNLQPLTVTVNVEGSTFKEDFTDLEGATYTCSTGDHRTAADAVMAALTENQYTYTGSSTYLSGITDPNSVSLTGGDSAFGSWSGWMFTVNGEMPIERYDNGQPIYATLGTYQLKDGDVVRMYYVACPTESGQHTWDDGQVTTAATCTENGVMTYTCTMCSDTKTEVIPATGHAYGEPVWSWTDGFKATATFTCTNDPSHVKNVTATVTNAVTTEATCESTGVRTYTAKVTFEGKEYTDTKTEVIPATGHAYGAPVWKWNDDFTASATFTCANDPSHVKNVTATVTNAVTTEATCESTGVRTYTAKVTFDGKDYTDTKTETLPATSHAYGEPVWKWNDDFTASATFTCANDTSHVKKVDATVTSEVTEGSCEVGGTRTYTAKVTFDGKDYTDTKTEPVPAKGHTLTAVEAVPATCETAGVKAHWVCSVCGKLFSDAEGKTETTLEKLAIPATGHAYGAPVWKWNDDFTASATFTCGNDASHVETVNAAVTNEVTTAATCETTGVRTYTAKVTFEDKEYTDTKTEVIPATSHDTELVGAKDATCTEDGYTGNEVCKVCQTVVKQGEVIPALGHDYKDGKCSRCGAEEPTTPVEPGKPHQPEKPTTPDTPATGDESQLMLWVSGMLVCALGAGLMLRRKKEN